MNIGNIGNVYVAYNYTNKLQNDSGKTFGATIGNVTKMPSSNLTLHMSKEADAEKSVGSWANANTGQSITIYQPQDYNPGNADSYEMYALSVYGEKSGKCPDAVARFTMMHAKQEAEQRAQSGSYDLGARENWSVILKNLVKEQYEIGFMEGYLKNKAYLDFLAN